MQRGVQGGGHAGTVHRRLNYGVGGLHAVLPGLSGPGNNGRSGNDYRFVRFPSHFFSQP